MHLVVTNFTGNLRELPLLRLNQYKLFSLFSWILAKCFHVKSFNMNVKNKLKWKFYFFTFAAIFFFIHVKKPPSFWPLLLQIMFKWLLNVKFLSVFMPKISTSLLLFIRKSLSRKVFWTSSERLMYVQVTSYIQWDRFSNI